ncbi:MAG: VanZ family protein [bacterium]
MGIQQQREKKSLATLTGYMGLLLIVSSIPGHEPHSRDLGYLLALVPPIMQNLFHVPAYGVLALLWIRTLQAYGIGARPSMWAAFVLASSYGALLELYQLWIPGRFPSLWDFALNVVGILLFSRLYWRAIRPAPAC